MYVSCNRFLDEKTLLLLNTITSYNKLMFSVRHTDTGMGVLHAIIRL